MACIEFENQIPDYLEKQLSPAEQSHVATHLAGCAACRAFARQLEQLDVALARTVNPPTLSPEFRTRLQQRIQTIPVWSQAEIAERKRQLQAEYEAGLVRLSLVHLPLRRTLKAFGYVVLLGTVGWLVWRFLPQVPNLLARLSPTLDQNLPIALIVSALCLVMGLAAAAFPRQLRRVLLVARPRG
jgi:predicted anti-sigma-YlaC factor YlaD